MKSWTGELPSNAQVWLFLADKLECRPGESLADASRRLLERGRSQRKRRAAKLVLRGGEPWPNLYRAFRVLKAGEKGTSGT